MIMIHNSTTIIIGFLFFGDFTFTCVFLPVLFCTHNKASSSKGEVFPMVFWFSTSTCFSKLTLHDLSPSVQYLWSFANNNFTVPITAKKKRCSQVISYNHHKHCFDTARQQQQHDFTCSCALIPAFLYALLIALQNHPVVTNSNMIRHHTHFCDYDFLQNGFSLE